MNSMRRSQQGFGLIDCLLSLVVVCVGMLALASLHLGLARGSDALRQRGEATRRAQSLVEQLRVPDASQEQSPPVTLDNTAYQTRSTRNGLQLSVAVTWQDRAGQSQSTRLVTQVSLLDAAGLAVQAFAAPPSTFTADARHGSIPVDIEKRDSSKSPLRADGLSFTYTVDAVSGLVTQRCAKSGGTDAELHGCQALQGHLVSGFVRFGPGVPEAGLALDAMKPLLVVPVQGSVAPAAFDCSATLQFIWRDPVTGRLSRLPATQRPIAGALKVDRFIAYTCVATPVDDDQNPATATSWSGDLTLNPSGWKAGAEPGSYEVRRLGHTTQHVVGSIDQQNFLVVPADTINVP